MTQVQYLSLSGPGRAAYNFGHFFVGIPHRIAVGLSKTSSKLYGLWSKITHPVEVISDAAVYGDWRTRLSFLLMGFGHLTRHQLIRGTLYLIYEAFFIAFMVLIGGPNLTAVGSLGQMAETQVNINGVWVYYYYDNSLQILIYSALTVLFIIIMVYLYISQLSDSLKLQRGVNIGRIASDKQTLRNVFDANYSKTLLAIPMTGVVIFTVIPVALMILMGFTNYNSNHLSPTALIDWVGLQNFAEIFGANIGSGGAIFLQTFGLVLLWTLLWAVFATFSNYFIGMIVAMIINKKGIRLKKLWRTMLITTIAVPQFISLLLMSRMLNTDMGLFNQWLLDLGWITQGLPWLTDAMLSKFIIIIVNTWIGIPYTMLICTGLLMNIPADLYESAKIDGAGPTKTYFKITLPYMLFVTAPYLISQFVGNINNFNVIYLLSGGGPAFTFPNAAEVPTQLAGVGETDLLITWIYKLCMTQQFKDYGTASVLGLLVFVVVAFFSLIFYSNSKSIKNEEDFQL